MVHLAHTAIDLSAAVCLVSFPVQACKAACWILVLSNHKQGTIVLFSQIYSLKVVRTQQHFLGSGVLGRTSSSSM